ncbi:MAG TPA: 6,7-dimethyl-8-ribityllumazine synthase, partial [Solirubrobacterales bacterium]|nr:6,7-dimethyl-8-ribityllumazine synthase [Solirubrobacterales bacterium]
MPEPEFTGRFCVVVGNFYTDLADRLVGGAKEEFARDGISDAEIDVYEVPGAFELPLAAGYAARSGRYDGVACLGAVIRGETDH